MNWIKESFAKSKKIRNHFKLHAIDIFIKDPLPDNIDPDFVFKYVSKQIPSSLLRGVDIVYVGQFDVFREKKVNAIFEDGAIYITNQQSSNQDFVDDIIHEIAHATEEMHTELIYEDQLLKREFLAKRKNLYWVLQTNDYKPYSKIANTYHYDKEIDMYFYEDVGYDSMWHIITGIFPTPYSATSLREYFAIGFEEYFIGDRALLKRDCPVLYVKLRELDFMEDQ